MFLNRYDAGKRLASFLVGKITPDSLIVSLPRGGVVIGDAIASRLKIPHAVLVVKKIASNDNPELAIGATGSDGIVYWDNNIISDLKISKKEKNDMLQKTQRIVREKEKSLGVGLPNVRGKNVIIVDDGVATGATSIAASLILQKLGSSKNTLATPIISEHTMNDLKRFFDEIITAELPRDFRSLSEFYEDFPQIKDIAVRKILNQNVKRG